MEPGICTKSWVKNSSGAKFPAITCGYSMVKFAHLNDAFFKVFQLQASPLESQSLHVGHFLISKFWFLRMPEPKCCKTQYKWKKGKLSSCRCLFDQIKANLANIQPENLQNVQKKRFGQKAPGVNGLTKRNMLYKSWNASCKLKTNKMKEAFGGV